MKTLRSILLLSLLLFLNGLTSGQENNPDQFRYGIAIKQTFTNWGDCSNSRPRFDNAEVVMKLKEGDSISKTIDRDALGKIIPFEQSFHGNSSFHTSSLQLHTIEAITIDTYVSLIENDKRQTYKSLPDTWRVGINEPVSREASDPCSNNANWRSRREGYTVYTTVIVDDPVIIAPVPQETVQAEREYLELQFNDFYWQGQEHQVQLEYKVNVEGHHWTPLPQVNIRPGKKTYIAYSQLAGRKNDPGSNYYDWIGKQISFRVKKTLINNSRSFGNTVEVAFSSPGPAFRVLEVKTPWCNTEPVVEVEIQDRADATIFNLEGIKWVAKDSIPMSFYFTQEHVEGNIYRLVPIFENQDFDFQTGGEWTLQLQYPSNGDLDFVEHTFTIPPRDNKIEVNQTSELFPAGNPKFHLLSDRDPYVTINVTDGTNRLPYTIFKKSNGEDLFVDSLKTKPDNFDALDISKQDSIYQSFVNDMDANQKGKRGTPWEEYFNKRFNNWFFENARPVKTDILTETEESECNSGYDDCALFVMSDNAKYLLAAPCYCVHNVRSIELTYANKISPREYHDFWKRNAKSENFTFDPNTAASGTYNNGEIIGTLSVDDNGNYTSSGGLTPECNSPPIFYNYEMIDYNACYFIGRSNEDDYFIVKNIGDWVNNSSPPLMDFFDGILDSTGTNCAYRNEAGSLLYFYDLEKDELRSWPAHQITNIRYVNTTEFPNYVVYDTESGDRYKQNLLDESNKEAISNRFFTTEQLYIKWYNDFVQDQWQMHLMENYGHRLYEHTVVNPPADETYYLIDKDNCRYEFTVNVKVPEQPVFKVLNQINPGTNCSVDGELTLTCETTDLLPLSCNFGTISSDQPQLTVQGLAWADTIHFYNPDLQLSYGYPVLFTGNANGIQSVEASAQTCGADPDGSVRVVCAPNSTSSKTYKLTNRAGDLIESVISDANVCVFKGLKTHSAYKVSVDVDGCTLYWPDAVPVGDEVFTMEVVKTDAERIGGEGSAEITIANIPQNVQWTGTAFAGGTTIQTFAPGPYLIEARHEGCTTRSSFEILEPRVRGDITIEKVDDNLSVAVSNLKFNDLIKSGKLIIKDNSGEEHAFNSPLPSGKEYALYFNYNSNQLEMYRFKGSDLDLLEARHQINTSTPKCPGDALTLTLVPENIDLDIKANFEGKYSHELETTTALPFVKYSLLTTRDSLVIHAGSELIISSTLQRNYEAVMPRATPVSGTARALDATCHGTNDGEISILNTLGGSGNYQWCIHTNDTWMDASTAATGLSPGEYKVYLKDSSNGCDSLKISTVTIIEPASLSVVDTLSVDPVCEKENGSIFMEVSGGNGAYSYVLEKDSLEFLKEEDDYREQGTFSFDSLSHGHYKLTINDPNACAISTEFELKEYTNPAFNPQSVDAGCYGDTDGIINIREISGSNPVDSLFLYNSVGGAIDTLTAPLSAFGKLSAGSYKLQVRDTMGCWSDTLLRTVHQPEPLSLLIDTIRPVVGKGSHTGFIRSRVSGGNHSRAMTALLTQTEGNPVPDKELSVSEKHPFDFKSLPAGTWQIKISDYKGCSTTGNEVTIEEPDQALKIEVLDIQDALCKADIGSFTIRGQGGWGNYTYKRATHNGFTPINTFNRLTAGSYTVSVEDGLGASFDTTLVIREPNLLALKEAEITLPTCNNNGVIDVEVSGGVLPYSMVFVGNADTLKMNAPGRRTFNNLRAGVYRLETVDSNGCRAVLESALSDRDLLAIRDIEPWTPSRQGARDGRLTATVTGGREPFTYRWTDLSHEGEVLTTHSATLTDIPSGYYQLTVMQEDGCSASDKQYLPDVNHEKLQLSDIGHETRWRAGNGYATLLSASDPITTVEVYYPNNQVVQFNGNETAEGFKTAGPSIFLTNLIGGKYLVMAHSDGAVEVGRFEIKGYEVFEFQNIHIDDIAVRNDASGAVKATVTGGEPDYEFQWEAISGSLNKAGYDIFQNVGIAHGLPAGNYRLTVTDGYDNSISETLEIREPAADLNLLLSAYTHQSCKDTEDAYAEVTASGGWGDYQFRKAGTDNFQNLNRWNNLPVGEHWFYLIDGRGVIDSVSVNIAEPDYLRARTALVDTVTCYGDATGKVFFHIEGGTGPYRFSKAGDEPVWMQSTAMLDLGEGMREYYMHGSLPEGKRVYRFTDANGCLGRDTLEVYVPQPDKLLFKYANVTPTTCNTDNGIIEVAMQGGTQPYRYQWLENSGKIAGTSATASGLKQNGTYLLNVWDKNNCHQQMEQFIKPSTNPRITGISTEAVLCYGDTNGTASITGVAAAEPYAPYRFIWSGQQTGESAAGLPAGRHHVTIRDTNRCESTRYFDIDKPDTLGLSIVSLKNAHCFGYSDGHIEIKAFGGTGDYRYLWSNGGTSARAVDLAKGEHSLSITDANNCVFEQEFVIDEPEMERVDIGDDLMMCPGNTIVIDGRDFVAHEWFKEDELVSTERYFTVAREGDYFLKVTNERSCFAYDTIAVGIGNNALQADFLMTSEASVGDTLRLYELSNLPLDSLSWQYQFASFINKTPGGADDYILHLKTLEQGMFNVALYAYSGGCFSKQVKQVEVTEGSTIEEEDDLLGYRDPLIESFVVSPNPSNGSFNVSVGLHRQSDIHLAIFSVSKGIKLEERRSIGLKDYSESFVLTHVNTGVYMVILTAGNERRQLKIIIE